MISPKDFHNAFMDTNRPEDVMSYYVNRAENNSQDSVEEMKQAIDWEEYPGCYLFSGLRGAGKTTELQRLQQELEKAGTPTFYCNADAYLDLNDPNVSQTELVFTALAGLSDAVTKKFGKQVLNETIWERLKSKMNSEVTLQPTLKAGLGDIEAEIEFSLKENITFKQQLIKFSRSSSSFFQEANQFANEVADLIQSQTGKDKIVLIVDSLERLSAPNGQETLLFESLKDLFYNAPARLFFEKISLIYTVPPYIHAVLPGIDQFYSGTFSLPNFKIMKTPAQNQAIEKNPDGIAKMVNVVEKRFIGWRNFLSQQVVEELAWLSGGNIRRMFALIRHATKKAVLCKANFPLNDINSLPVEQAIQEETRNLQWLNSSDRRWLNHCLDQNGNLAQCIEDIASDLPPIIRLFDHSLVLDYRNGQIWYQVPPIIHGKF